MVYDDRCADTSDMFRAAAASLFVSDAFSIVLTCFGVLSRAVHFVEATQMFFGFSQSSTSEGGQKEGFANVENNGR